MESQKAGSLKISGSGTGSGGVYSEISISGSGKVTGDVEAEQIRVSGSGHFEGNVKADRFAGSGSFAVDGNLQAKECKCSGAGRIGGAVRVAELHVSGSMKIEGSVKGGEIHLSGGGRFGSDVEAERFRSSGSLNISGLLNADKVEIAFGDNCRVREIGGEQIIVTLGSCGFLGFGRGILQTESIEGDEIYLEATHAGVVRGKRVTIGPGCRIDHVEYSESLKIDPEAEVTRHNYTGEGPGEPPVDTNPVSRPGGWGARPSGKPGRWSLMLGSHRYELGNPVAKAVVGLLATLFALAVVILVLGTVLPAVGIIVVVVLAIAFVVVLVALLATPAVIAGSLVLTLITLPLRLIAGLFGWHPRRHAR